MDELSMDYTRLGIHASKAAHDYLVEAIETVEKLMGKGAAERFPMIVAALVQASATDYQASMLSHRVYPGLESISLAIRDVAEAVSSLRDE